MVKAEGGTVAGIWAVILGGLSVNDSSQASPRPQHIATLPSSLQTGCSCHKIKAVASTRVAVRWQDCINVYVHLSLRIEAGTPHFTVSKHRSQVVPRSLDSSADSTPPLSACVLDIYKF